jgi:hypothetical protein
LTEWHKAVSLKASRRVASMGNSMDDPLSVTDTDSAASGAMEIV